MHEIIGNQRQRGLEWAVPRLNAGPGHWDDASCLILERGGSITAVAVYNRWYPKNSVEISIAAIGGRWLTRPFLSAVFRAPFVEWEMRRVGSSIASDNHKSIRFCEHLGFQREGCIRQGAPNGQDLLLYGLLKNECRFLRKEFEQAVTSRSARSDHNGERANAIQHCDGDKQRCA